MSRLVTPHLGWLIRREFLMGLFGTLLLITPLFLMGCERSDAPPPPPAQTPAASSAPVNKEGNYITATPNPVPAGPESHGKTMVTWGTKGYPSEQVQVYVAEQGKQENLFSTGSPGSQEAPWISSELPIEFRLYGRSGSERKLLEKVVVTRNK